MSDNKLWLKCMVTHLNKALNNEPYPMAYCTSLRFGYYYICIIICHFLLYIIIIVLLDHAFVLLWTTLHSVITEYLD